MSGSAYASALGLAAAAVLLCAVVTLWRRSLGAIVRVLAVQGVALACVAMVIGLHEHDAGLIVVGRARSRRPRRWSCPSSSAGWSVTTRPVARPDPLVNVPASLVAAGALDLPGLRRHRAR